MQSDHWLTIWQQDIHRSLQAMNKLAVYWQGDVSLSQISFATALGYLEFRLPELLPQQDDYVQMLDWYAAFKQRASMQSTQPE